MLRCLHLLDLVCEFDDVIVGTQISTGINHKGRSRTQGSTQWQCVVVVATGVGGVGRSRRRRRRGQDGCDQRHGRPDVPDDADHLPLVA